MNAQPEPTSASPMRHALVTGGSRGLGRALCAELARQNWRVALTYRERHAEAQQSAREASLSGIGALALQADQRDRSAVNRAFAELGAAWNRLDLLICNAAINRDRLISRLHEDEWDELIETNLSGTWRVIQAALPLLLQAKSPCILLIGSHVGVFGRAGQAAYSASKAALIGLGKSLAREFAPQIRVNIILPGFLETQMSHESGPATRDRALAENLLGAIHPLDLCAKNILRYAELCYTTGAILPLDSRPIQWP